MMSMLLIFLHLLLLQSILSLSFNLEMCVRLDLLKSSIEDLSLPVNSTFDKAKNVGTYLRRNNIMSRYTAERIRKEITDINRTHISKLKDKLIVLCDNSRWKNIGNIDIIQNISAITLTPVELEALQFGLKFTTGIN